MGLKSCKECGGEVSSKADACPKCGAKVSKTSIFKIGCLSVIVGFFGLAALGALFGDSSKQGNTATSTGAASTAVEAAPPPPQIRWVSDSCKAMAKNFGLKSKLTDLQKKAIWEESGFGGRHFKWPLKVASVDTTFGSITAQFKCKGSSAFVSDILLRVDDEAVALKLIKGEFYNVHGTLKDWGNFTGMSGDLVELTE